MENLLHSLPFIFDPNNQQIQTILKNYLVILLLNLFFYQDF